ncbi:DUF4189 domain-containing protein [Methylobacterium sp. A54F]
MKFIAAALLAACLGSSTLGSSTALAAGAFAVDTERGQAAGDEGYGIGWGDTREEAGAAALRECRKVGNNGCKVVARFDSCGAYVSNRTSYGVGWGRTEGAAKQMAFDQCPNCKLVLSECE